jgi:hypothetical protein
MLMLVLVLVLMLVLMLMLMLIIVDGGRRWGRVSGVWCDLDGRIQYWTVEYWTVEYWYHTTYCT